MRLFLNLVVRGDLLQVVGLEDLIAVQTTDVIDPIAAHQEFRALMFTARHTKLEYTLF
ncbi:MAG TPA: hypothetical protein VGG72_17875 [Bryobacteraceae bacterium]